MFPLSWLVHVVLLVFIYLCAFSDYDVYYWNISHDPIRTIEKFPWPNRFFRHHINDLIINFLQFVLPSTLYRISICEDASPQTFAKSLAIVNDFESIQFNLIEEVSTKRPVFNCFLKPSHMNKLDALSFLA